MGVVKKFRIKSFKNPQPIISLEKISLSFGKRKILDNVNFKINHLIKLNVNDHSVKNIWNSHDYNELRKNHRENNRSRVTPCSRCVVV